VRNDKDKKNQDVRKKVTVAALILLVVCLVGWLAYAYYMPGKPLMEDIERQNRASMPATFSDIKVPATIFYPGDAGLIKEEKTVAAGSLPVKMVESVLHEYFAGFKNELKNTVVRGVYRDRNRIFYIDLSDEFRRNFSGDARYEYYLLKSLYQTIVSNVSDARDVKILIEGREIESLGGHMVITSALQDSVSY
jgi:hypothetical protein